MRGTRSKPEFEPVTSVTAPIRSELDCGPTDAG